MSRCLFTAAATAVLFAMASPVPVAVADENFPERPVTIIVAAGEGGGTDLAMRFLEPQLSEVLGQPVVFDNRPGAGGDTGAMAVVRAAPDGYTMLGVAGTITVNPSVKDVPYDLLEDLAPVTLVVKTPSVLVGHPSLEAENVAELVQLASEDPGALSYGSAGAGSIPHLQMEVFLDLTDTEMLHVPYPTIRPALNDVMAGHIDLAIVNITTAMPLIEAGSVRAYGVTTSQRADLAPDIPTLSEAGAEGYEAVQWFGLFAPADTPAEILGKLNAAVNEAMQAPETLQRYQDGGSQPEPMGVEEFGEFVRAEVERWANIVEMIGLEAE